MSLARDYPCEVAHLLGADGIALTIGTRTLLSDVSLGLDDGDRVGVVGPNGAGKSTLLRILAGTSLPDGGRVTISARVESLEQIAATTLAGVMIRAEDTPEAASPARAGAARAGA